LEIAIGDPAQTLGARLLGIVTSYQPQPHLAGKITAMVRGVLGSTLARRVAC